MNRYRVQKHFFTTDYWGIYDTFANAFVRLPSGRDSWLDENDCQTWLEIEQLNNRN